MNFKAIDIVLIPPKLVMETIISLNSEIIKTSELKNNLELNTSNYIPHISIRMGIINTKNIDHITQKINSLKPPKTLTISKVEYHKVKENCFHHLLVFEKNLELFELHNKIMKITEFENILADPIFFANTPIKENTLNYVNNFENYAFSNFHPHITLGKGPKTTNFKPISFTPTISVYQLGNHCTCVNKLS